MTNPNDPAFANALFNRDAIEESKRRGPDMGGPLEFVGLTKREYFAAMAMQGIIANRHTVPQTTFEEVAHHSLVQADALIAELNKSK